MVLAMPWLTQHLDAVDYGVFGIATAVTGALQAVATLGFPIVLTTSFYHSPNRYKMRWRQIYGFFIRWSVVHASLLAGLLLLLLPAEASGDYQMICLLNMHMLVFGYGSLMGQLHYTLKQRPLPLMLRAMGFGLLNVSIACYLIIWENAGYMGWFWGNFIGTSLLNLSYIYPVIVQEKIRPIFTLKKRYFKKHLALALPMLPHYYSSYLLDISDRLVMSVLRVPTNFIGRYNSTYLFGNYFQMLGTTTGNAVGPMLMEQLKQGNAQNARNLTFAMMGAFVAGTFIVSVWLKELFYLLIKNDELQAMYPLGIIIIMGYAYRPIYLAVNAILVLSENTKSLWRISFAAGIGNLVLNLILIPVFGYQAAAFTTWLALMYMGFSGFYLKAVKQLNTEAYYPIRWLVGIAGLTLLAYVVVDSSYWVKGSVTAICLTVLGWGLWLSSGQLKKL